MTITGPRRAIAGPEGRKESDRKEALVSFGSEASREISSAHILRLPAALDSMRPLTEEETKAVFSKLANYIVSLCTTYSNVS